jgi:ParB family chromosome partitioning protein
LQDIEVNPEQPRRAFGEGDIEELMQSLEQHGMLQPMVVMEKDDGTYQIIAGERRWRAAKQLGWAEVPCVVRSGVTGDKNRLELALTENVQRENLNPIEEALGYKRLNEEYGMSHEEIGERVGKSRVAITNMIRVLQLPDEVQKGLIDEKITMGHARAILMIPDAEKQVRFYEHVVDEGLTVRKTEIRARNIQRSMNAVNPMASRAPRRNEFGGRYEAMLQNYYGFNAKVKFNAPRNRFEVRFYAHSEQECNDLVEMLLRHKEVPKNVDADVLED